MVNVSNGRNSFPSEESIGKNVEGQIERGGSFWGILEAFDDVYLYLRGTGDQEIIIKRKAIARLVVG
jgi:hypothetical protein